MKQQLRFNRNNKNTGKPMKTAGMRASAIAHLGQLAKGHGDTEVTPVVKNRPGKWMAAWAGASTPVHVTKIGADLYRVTWIRPEGRKGTFTEKGGKNEIIRSVSVRCDADLEAWFLTIGEGADYVEVDIVH